ncbi:SDR family NAD(P)-dependent oxidoreductase [Candidatus Woesearchaeota archaeon]|nr:SDR family NAD(P)-dependent oxidoreductase [Candidatus Woesearchaeota archaeon]
MKYENLKNKVVMVTGASSGLGEALARAFIENDCTVYLSARSKDKLVALSEELGDRAIPLSLDVTNTYQVYTAAERIINEQGRIDVWVNNAGGEKKSSLSELTPKLLNDITAVNYFGLVYGTQAAAEYMRKQKEGDIVQILSTSAFTSRANESAYCAAKAAASLFSESVQLELRDEGIRVFPIYPGGMNTEFFMKAGASLPPDSMEPKDIADIVLNALSQPRNIIVVPRIFRNSVKKSL